MIVDASPRIGASRHALPGLRVAPLLVGFAAAVGVHVAVGGTGDSHPGGAGPSTRTACV
jgi:hypothetical protein